MVLQYPRHTSEVREYDEAPLDLSISNRTRCPSPPRSPDDYRESLSPDFQDYRDTSSPHDSDDSDSQRPPHNSAKAYKKAMMRRYRK